MSLSSVARLLLGITTAEREKESAVLAFAIIVRDAKEKGTLKIPANSPRAQINKIANRLVACNEKTLQKRVDDLIKREPRTLIARALASSIRAYQEENQQILFVTQQLANALNMSISKMNLSRAEQVSLNEISSWLERTGLLASKEINDSLLLANDSLVENGAAGELLLTVEK
jgi:hypothetical protein